MEVTQDNAEVEKKKKKKQGARIEKLVKYMTNLPSYLQRPQSGVQALNIGVLDWERLERLKEEQNLVLRRSASKGSSPAPTNLYPSSEEKPSRLDSGDCREEKAKMGTSLGKLPDHVLKPPICHDNHGKENHPLHLVNAMLHVSYKDGIPFFTFKSNAKGGILVARKKKVLMPGNDNFECV